MLRSATRKALGQVAHDEQGNVGIFRQAALELRLADHHHFAGLDRQDGSRTRMVVEHPHFAEQFSGTEQGKDDLAPLLVADLHLQGARKNEVDVVRAVAGMQHDGMPRHGAQHGHASQRLEAVVVEHLEDRQRAQYRQ
jgi:hypothetical protein